MHYRVLGDDLMLHYCNKCGRILQNSWGDEILKCDCCQSVTYPVPEKYLLEGFDIAFKDDETEQLLIEELVKTSPEFDQYLFDHRDEILEKKSAEFSAKMEHGKAILEAQGRVPKCPCCGSTNISKIGAVSRVVSTSFFGLASSKIGKTHKCNNCGTTW